MQAIVTKYLGPTNSRGSRVKVSAQATAMVVPWEYGCGNGTGLDDAQANHMRAARLFITRLGWIGRWQCGALPDGTGYAFTCIKRGNRLEVRP